MATKHKNADDYQGNRLASFFSILLVIILFLAIVIDYYLKYFEIY